MKRRTVFIFVFLCCGAMLHGQTGRERKNYIGIRTSFGTCKFSESGGRFTGPGTSSHTGMSSFMFALEYARRTSQNVDLCLGFTVIDNRLSTESTWWWGGGGGTHSSTTGNALFIFSFPVHLKYHFLRYLFIDGGVCANIHPSFGYKWGMGAGISAGGRYMFRSGLTVSLSPFMQWNLLNPLMQGESYEGLDIISQKGISMGLGYQF